MIKEYCDRCGVDTTGQRTGAFAGIDDAYRDGSGTETDSFNILCRKCYHAIVVFIKTAPPTKAKP